MATKRTNTKIVKLTDEQIALRAMICAHKQELIDSKEFFDVGVNGTVLRARVTGAGKKAVKFCFVIGGISKTEKGTPSEFFLDYPELDDNLVAQLEEFCGENVEEVADEDITFFNVISHF